MAACEREYIYCIVLYCIVTPGERPRGIYILLAIQGHVLGNSAFIHHVVPMNRPGKYGGTSLLDTVWAVSYHLADALPDYPGSARWYVGLI